MSKRKWILSAAFCLFAAGMGMVLVRPIRWRVHLAALKASGKIQDVSWSELARLMARHSGLDSGVMLKTKDPYAAISAPEATPERVRAGHELFNQQCAPCHGVDATGGMAPNLTKGEFVHGASDWGLYKTITRGIPGTPMQRAIFRPRMFGNWCRS
jgi:mono/diheme cytochrome c family protein